MNELMLMSMPSNSNARTTGSPEAVRHPSRRSRATDLTESRERAPFEAWDGAALPGRWARAMHSDTNRNEAASITSAHAALATAISTPAAALPSSDIVSLAVENRLWAVVSRSTTDDGGHDGGARRVQERREAVELEDGHEGDHRRQVTDHGLSPQPPPPPRQRRPRWS